MRMILDNKFSQHVPSLILLDSHRILHTCVQFYPLKGKRVLHLLAVFSTKQSCKAAEDYDVWLSCRSGKKWRKKRREVSCISSSLLFSVKHIVLREWTSFNHSFFRIKRRSTKVSELEMHMANSVGTCTFPESIFQCHFKKKEHTWCIINKRDEFYCFTVKHWEIFLIL